MTFSTASFTNSRNALHGIVEPQWFPADPYEKQSKLTALEQAEKAHNKRLQDIIESQAMHPVPNLKSLPTNHHYQHSKSRHYNTDRHGRRRKVRLSDSIGGRSSTSTNITTPTIPQSRPRASDLSHDDARSFLHRPSPHGRSRRSRASADDDSNSRRRSSSSTVVESAMSRASQSGSDTHRNGHTHASASAFTPVPSANAPRRDDAAASMIATPADASINMSNMSTNDISMGGMEEDSGSEASNGTNPSDFWDNDDDDD